MPTSELNVKLLRYTINPEIVSATAAKLCYSNSKVDDLVQSISKEDSNKLLNFIINSGHHSVLEHASFTFAIEGISRVCSHQLVRHRIASYSQQSQRYVNVGEFNYVLPPTIKNNPKALSEFNKAIKQATKSYVSLNKLVPKEDARFVLPNACETKLVMTMNTRALYNFFEKRLCHRAQWEINALAHAMLKEVKKVAPILFEHIAEPCKMHGICKEGKMSCGLYKKFGGKLKQKPIL